MTTLSDPERLRRELMLRAMFPVMPGEALVRFAELLQPVSAAAGTTLFEAGSAADRIYFVVRGKLALVADGEAPWLFGPRAVIGIIDAMIGRPRARSGEVLESSDLFQLKATDWFDLLEDDASVARGAIKNFASQFHSRWRTVFNGSQAGAVIESIRSVPATLSTYDKILALRDAAFLKSAGMQAIASLAGVAEEERREGGVALFGLGEASGDLRVIVSGKIEVRSAPDFRLVQGAGDLVGGPAAVSGSLRSYSALSLTPSVVLRIHEQDYYDQIEEHGRLTRGTLAYLVTQLERVLRVEPPRADT